MISSGTSPLRAVHVLGDRPDLVFREAPERVGDELEIVGEVGRAGAVLRALLAERVEERGRAVRGDEAAAPARARSASTPHVRLAAEHAGGDVDDRVGDVGPGEHRLDLAVLAVVAHDLRALDRGGRVGEVVREHLVLVELGDGDLAALDGRRSASVPAALFDDAGDRRRRRRGPR